MPSPFTSVTKVALEEMVREHATPSKFGYFLSQEAFDELIAELVGFMATSRSLKSAGDRLLGVGQGAAPASAPAVRPGRPSRYKTP